MSRRELGAAADKLSRLAAIELREGDRIGSRNTEALARRLTDELNRPGDLSEAIRAFVDSTLHLADLWHQAGPEAAFVLGDSYGLELDFDELAARVADWEIPGGSLKRTHAMVPVEIIARFADLLQRLGDVLEAGEWGSDLGPQVAWCYAEVLGLADPRQAVAALDEEPLRAQRALVETLRDSVSGLRTRDWPT